MKLITRQSQADAAPENWARQYSGKGWGGEFNAIARALAALSAPIDPDEVDRIIGNSSWTSTPCCSACQQRPPVVAHVGEEPDYESRTAYLCKPCAQKALALFDAAE